MSSLLVIGLICFFGANVIIVSMYRGDRSEAGSRRSKFGFVIKKFRS